MADDSTYEPFTKSSASLLPGSNSSPYKAAAAVDSEVTCLVLVMGRDGFLTGATAYYLCQYVHIGLVEFGYTKDGQVFRFIVSDLEPKRVTVHGRNLLRICHQIALRRMQWIRQADRDLRAVGGEDTEPVITRIEVEDWQRPKPAAAPQPLAAALQPA